MKHITLSAVLLCSIGTVGAQIFQNDLEAWTGNVPTGMVGARTNLSADSIFLETENPHGGTSAARLQLADDGHKRFTTQPVTVVAGTPYEITFWVRGTGRIRTNIYDGRPTDSGYGLYNPYVDLVASDWQEVTQTVTATMNTAVAEFIFSIVSTEGPTHIVIDDITIEEGEVVPPTAATIFEIQNTTDLSGASPLVNQAVITSGIVTAVKSGTGYFLQDGAGAWNGIYVNDAVNTPTIGDQVEVTATVQENFDFTRLVSVVGHTVLSAGNSLPAPEVLSPSGAASEPWESVLVNVPDVECVVLPTPENFQQWTVSNWQGSIFVDDFLFAATPSLGSFYSITGLVNYSFEEWKLWPREVGDIGVGSAIRETKATQLTVQPNPTADRVAFTIGALDGPVTYELRDAAGRLVASGSVIMERMTLDLAGLANGAYTLQARDADRLMSARVMVQH